MIEVSSLQILKGRFLKIRMARIRVLFDSLNIFDIFCVDIDVLKISIVSNNYRLRSHLYNRSQLRFFLSKKFEDGEWTSVNVVHLKCGLWSGKRSEMNRRVVQI